MYQGTKRDITWLKGYRRCTIYDNFWNQRNQGRKKCRRSYSSKAVSKEYRCNDYDEDVFYIVLGIGDRNNTHHSLLKRHSHEKKGWN